MNRLELIKNQIIVSTPNKLIKERELRKIENLIFDHFDGIDFLELPNLICDFDKFYENIYNEEFIKKYSEDLIDIALEIKSLLETNQEIPEKFKPYIIK